MRVLHKFVVTEQLSKTEALSRRIKMLYDGLQVIVMNILVIC